MLEEKRMALVKLDHPESFTFKKPEEWQRWKRRFEQFRVASGLKEASAAKQVSTGSFYIDSTHICFIFGSIFVDECRLLPCVYLCIILTFKYQLFVSY